MERLTIRNGDGTVSQPTGTTVEAAFYQLADFEDIGFTPNQIKDMVENVETACLTWFEGRYGFPIGKLMDLIEAQQVGHLLKIPCKVGDVVWVLYDGKVIDLRVQGISVAADSQNVILRFGGYPEYSAWGRELGKTWFITREEAEKALKGDAKDD